MAIGRASSSLAFGTKYVRMECLISLQAQIQTLGSGNNLRLDVYAGRVYDTRPQTKALPEADGTGNGVNCDSNKDFTFCCGVEQSGSSSGS